MVGQLFDRGRPELVFMIFAGAFALAAICWLGVDVTQRLTDTPAKPDLAFRNEV
jgi:hypothetical protein